jgi:hypothetical protein
LFKQMYGISLASFDSSVVVVDPQKSMFVSKEAQSISAGRAFYALHIMLPCWRLSSRISNAIRHVRYTILPFSFLGLRRIFVVPS